MKTNIYSKIMSATFAAASLVSCTEDTPVVNTETLSEIQFTAMSNASRTSLTDGNDVVWNKSDMIGVFASGDTKVYQFTNNLESDGQAEATFTGVAPENATTYYALYPYSESSTLSSTTITTVLSGSQTAMAGTFANNLNISVATATADKNLQFKNVCGLIKFKLTDVEGVKALTLVSNDENQTLSGTLQVNMNDNTATILEGSNSISLIAENGFNTGNDYYMVVPPVTFSNGFKIKLSDGRYAEGKSGYVVDAGKINTISISSTDLAQGELEIKDVIISSIDEIEPAENGDRLLLKLAENVSIGEFLGDDFSAFDIKVTNNGDNETKLNVTSVAKGTSANKIILTLSNETPVYFDDKLSVQYNGEKLTTIVGNKVCLKSNESTTYTGYVKLIYSEDFERSTTLTDYMKWNSPGWSIGVQNESNVLQGNKISDQNNNRLLIPAVQIKRNGYYTLQYKGFTTSAYNTYIIFETNEIFNDKSKASVSKNNTITDVSFDVNLNDLSFTNPFNNKVHIFDENGIISLHVYFPKGDVLTGWIDNVKLYERECRNFYDLSNK
ncbi:hypothetical protein [Bacteroides sp.]|uniref:fimbrillin family protein n=1 Tax=Bacteroides sp. TaxID=29523 RepID=UPI0025C162E1|nr:hypothetical protein [Bacteroides sp.]